ncbi:dsDNA nuclease domain-containing protein [Bacillus paranthracis]|uniref:dsDNA nuclease domain-containing protein n=1 Tax=Bacillus paranthracis TaxID=2026186 RepID=UPI003CF88F31
MEQDKIISSLQHNVEKLPEEIDFFNNCIKNKSSEEIMSYLAEIPQGEMGGITAITGFYYQFLIAIKYLIELLDEKWDYVGIELHDDIVLGKGDLIRFVQVKTSKENVREVSEVPDLYLRKSKKIKGGDERYKVNNSWVDKLLSKAEFFRSDAGYLTQFQLVASYDIIRSQKLNVDIYNNTDNPFEKDIPDTDFLLENMSKKVYNIKGEEYSYETRCGESVRDLLSRFRIKKEPSIADLDYFINHLRIELSKRIFKEYKGEPPVISVEDLNSLIGLLCSNCLVNKEASTLLITKEQMESNIAKIGEDCMRRAEEFWDKNGNTLVIERVFNELIEEIKGFNLFSEIADDIYTYKEYILEWFQSEGNVRDLINRYVEGTVRSQAYFKMTDQARENKLANLVEMAIILNKLNRRILEFAKCKSLLTKSCGKENEAEIISIVGLESSDNLEKAKAKINLMMEKSDEADHLFLIDKKVRVVLQNYTDRKFRVPKKFVVNLEALGDSVIDNALEGDSFKQVPLITTLVPGEELGVIFRECLNEEEINQLDIELCDFWSTLPDTDEVAVEK